MTDLSRLIEGCKASDASCQKELYERFSPRFYALCRRYAMDSQHAEDLLVEGFMSVFSHIGDYAGRGNFEGWMYRIFVNTAISSYSHESRHRSIPLDGENDVAAPKVMDSLERGEVNDCIKRCLDTLSPRERLVFNLVAVEEMPYGEVAERLNMPGSTVRGTYQRARMRMQIGLERMLGESYLRTQ